MRKFCLFVVALVAIFAPADRAAAQLPTATGRAITMSNTAWKIFIPSTYRPRNTSVADVLVHFHGDPQTYWNNAQYANLNAIIVTVNYSGLSSVYETPFSDSTLFESLLDEALTKVRAQADFPDNLQWDKIGVSSFSAGYGAVREILKSSTYRNEISGLLAADSLYATTAADGTPLDSQMVDYKTFASLAKAGSKTFLYSHSQVPTPGYESTVECADELMQSLGISASAYNVNGLGTLTFYRHVKSGNFELWGATGDDAAAHSKHLQYIAEFLQHMPLAKVPTAGDYNSDGVVDAKDYVLWRDTVGSTTDLRANGFNAGGSANLVDAADFNVWKTNFGHTQAVVGSGGSADLAAAVPVGLAVPEPSSWVLAVGLGAIGALAQCASARPDAQATDSAR